MRMVSDYRFTAHGPDDLTTPVRTGRVVTYKGAYVSITSRCNTDACLYCYARDQKTAEVTMPVARFRNILRLLGEISDYPEVYLVGGEPTVVKELDEFLDAVADRGWTTTIYTNGGFTGARLDLLREHPAAARVSFHYDEMLFERYGWLRDRWDRNLAALAGRCEVSVIGVIDGPQFPFRALVDIAADVGASFTWIFSAPTSGGTPFLDLGDMRRLGPAVQDMLLYALDRGVTTSPDLPIPLCIFDGGFLREHADRFSLVRKCQPFAYFHVDGRVSYCTAMPVYTAAAPHDADELAGIIETHRAYDRALKAKPSFPECVTCEQHLHQTCQGGCMTYKVYGKEEQGVVFVDLLRTAPAAEQG